MPIEQEEPATERFQGLVSELHAALGKLEIALGATRDAIAWTNPEGMIQWCNDPFDRLAGRPHIELLGHPITEILALEVNGRPLPASSHPGRLILKSRSRITRSYEMRRDGRVLTVEVYAAWVQVHESPTLVVFVIRDISERTRAEEALRYAAAAAPAAERARPPTQASAVAPPEPGPLWPLASRWTRWAAVLGLACAYFVSAKLGLQLAFVNASATAVWPPTGIALAALLLLGYEVWPGILLGAFLANITTAGSIATSMGIASGNTLEGLVGAYLVRRFANGLKAFDGPRNVFKFTALAAMISTAVSATLGVTTLSLAGYARWTDYGAIWLTWWLGDAAGNIIVTPLLLLWSLDPRPRWSRWKAAEAGLLVLFLFLLGRAVFGQGLGSAASGYPLDFICIPPLFWAAYRFGQRETAAAACLLSAIAIWGTLHGFGPFIRGTPNGSLLLLQAFMGVTATTAMALASAVWETRRAEAALRESHEDLEQRIEQRTAGLSRANQALRLEIAQRKRMEAATRRLAAIVEHSDDAIVGTNLDGTIVSWNPGAQRIFGYGADEVVGMPLTLLAPPELRQEVLSNLERRRLGELVHCESKRMRKDGGQVDVSVTDSPVRDAAGSLLGFSVIMRNISERKLAEEELRKSEEALREKTKELARSNVELELFASTASHDLQEPLRKIIAFGDLLRKRSEAALDDTSRDMLERMTRSAGRMSRLIGDLLSLSRLSRDRRPFEAVDLTAVVSEVLSTLEIRVAEAGAHVEVGKLPTLRAHPLQMRQLMQNLIANALKFRSRTEPPRVTISSRIRPEGFAEITVQDNGIGFDPKHAEAIFEPFSRLNPRHEYEGSGVGLAICRRVMLRHGGWISATSAPGRGSAFLVTLPIGRSP